MIALLGKRPFTKADEMDKWLDQNSHRGESSAPPPFEGPMRTGDVPLTETKPLDPPQNP